MNRTSKMGALFQVNMLLRKKVDYQEKCLFRKIQNIINCSSKNGLPRKVKLIHVGKVSFL